MTGMLIALMLATAAHCGAADTPEALAEHFIAAVNAKSPEQQQAIIHPRCFASLSAVQKQFLEETLARDFRRTVPEQHTVKVSNLDSRSLPFGGMMELEWPIKPTHQFEIEFSTDKYSSTSIIRFIVKEKNEWFIIVPMLNAENLKHYEERKKSQPVASPGKK